MLQNARVTASTVSEPLRESQQGGEGGGQLPPTTIFTQIRVKKGIGNILYTKVNEKKEKTKLDLNCLNFKK